MDNTNMGKVTIAPDVVEIIVGLALSDISGVFYSDKRRGKKNVSKGIEIEINDNIVTCDIELAIGYDTKVPALAAEVQSKVKNAIENMTGLTVQEVNIHVSGIVKEGQEEE